MPGNDWTTARPSDVDLDGNRLDRLDALLAEWPDGNIHAVIVARRGKLVLERYFTGEDWRWLDNIGVVQFGPDVKHDVRSISKSVTALLVGIARSEGRFPDLDSPVFDAFPEYGDLRTPEKDGLTFRHLLTMSHGLAWDETKPWTDPANNEHAMLDASDPYRYTLEQPMARRPGELFTYCGGATSVLAAALAKSTGTKVDAYAREKLFGPLGIEEFDRAPFTHHPDPAAFGTLRLRPRDLAKIGQLMVDGGSYHGRQVLPQQWIADATTPRFNTDGLLYYGFQWWMGRSLLRGRDLPWTGGYGNGGQRLFIVPDLDLVVAINASHYGSPLQGLIPHAILNRLVLPAVLDG